MIKQNLSQKMLQKLSPQQIQLMKLLQIPSDSLEQRIKEELEANPALEEGDNISTEIGSSSTEENFKDEEEYESSSKEDYELDDYLNNYIEDDPSSYKYGYDYYNPDEEDKTKPTVVDVSYHQYLQEQMGMLHFSEEREQVIAEQIIGSIDDDGYLRREPEAIIDDLMFGQNVSATKEEILYWLYEIQKFDPPGTGARDLQECLLIQLKMKKKALSSTADSTDIDNAIQIVENYFEEFTKKHYKKMQRGLGVCEDVLRDAFDEIKGLNPKPASGYSTGFTNNSLQYIVPDFIVTNRDGQLELRLNSRNTPELHINNDFHNIIVDYKKKHKGRRADKKARETVMFVKQKIDSAKWFIDAIRQRHQTMMKTMQSILAYQKDFFLTGDEKSLKPMILKDIADMTGLDISTVSRVANSKYVQTEFGTKRLKEFFSESLTTDGGEIVSTLEVKKILTEIIEAENKRKPLSDENLKLALQEKGYNIARRTVAKYREQLNIPVARLRKQL